MAEVEKDQASIAEAERKLQEKNWAEIDDDEGDDDGDDQEIGIKDKDKHLEPAQQQEEETEKKGNQKRGQPVKEEKKAFVVNNLGPRTKNERGDYVVTSINIADRQSKKEG